MLTKLFQVSSNNSKPKTLIVLHGLLGSSRNFRSLVKNPAISSYRNTLLLDARNHGDSFHSDEHSVEVMAHDVSQVIKQVASQMSTPNPISLMGHSMGGLTLLKLTQLYPELYPLISEVILIDSPPVAIASRFPEGSKEMGTMLSRLANIQMKSKAAEDIYKEIEIIAGNKYTADLIRGNIVSSGKTNTNNNSQTNKDPYWRVNMPVLARSYQDLISSSITTVQNLKKPVHLIYGTKSKYISPREDEKVLKQLYPRARVKLWPIEGAGHWVHSDKAGQFLKAVEKIWGQSV